MENVNGNHGSSVSDTWYNQAPSFFVDAGIYLTVHNTIFFLVAMMLPACEGSTFEMDIVGVKCKYNIHKIIIIVK